MKLIGRVLRIATDIAASVSGVRVFAEKRGEGRQDNPRDPGCHLHTLRALLHFSAIGFSMAVRGVGFAQMYLANSWLVRGIYG